MAYRRFGLGKILGAIVSKVATGLQRTGVNLVYQGSQARAVEQAFIDYYSLPNLINKDQ